MNKDAKIYVAGHKGLVGSAILRALEKEGYNNLIYRSSSELDLRKLDDVYRFFEQEKIDYVFLAAAKVGGIAANNDFPADFIRDNLLIQTNVIDAAHFNGVKKLLFLGSTCIYPKFAPQPLKEEYLLTGELEPTNEPYAIAKIAGIKMCESYNRQYGSRFISAMPTNMYGPNDNFDLKSSHVLPALVRKIHEAKENNSPTVEIWGTGTPKREFLHADDLADACLFLMDNYEDNQIVNVGVGEDIAIKDLALMIKNIVGYEGDLVFNSSVPDGTPRKLVDTTKINALGWKASIPLEEGIRAVYADFRNSVAVNQ
ncbi:GDP-L-fucose synthase [Paenibacillus sp. PsM32]|uniref:GDP-L-fucose synthase n=2 Tax=Paenibacillus TaxID=44249 RepID=A0ABW4UM22_9BACL|nr:MULTISPECIES: GDP-L-fucose synthase [Paenibacillus]MDN4619420.1 GDP-L-fucose synthase [Paenibacillus sp. PsM32]MDQ1237040.1 GDP-L-fucose synthase [Paenibacillus sp. SORGH_AS_0306]MDR6109399.1 GDP-L-fucose synthase [Paenibacillus sp. SORGH_AS_0338]WCT56403.1 GDP-L-fucose synthase [Paenibacillus kyungheensis]WDF50479.1 GDP-L-fucose synthase [Paenibacillus sp. KACC 21273]